MLYFPHHCKSETRHTFAELWFPKAYRIFYVTFDFRWLIEGDSFTVFITINRGMRYVVLYATFPPIFFYSCAVLLLLWAENFYVIARHFKFSFVISIRICSVNIEKFQLRGNNLMCAGAFLLLRGRAVGRVWGNISCKFPFVCRSFTYYVRGGAVGWDTAPEAGRSRVRFPDRFFNYLILPDVPRPWGRLSPLSVSTWGW
jgi:hypothetical protein